MSTTTFSLKRFLACLTLIVLAAAPAAAGQGRHGRLDAALQRAAHGGGTERVIVRALPGARGSLRADLEARGYRVRGERPSLDALVADVPAQDLEALSNSPHVASVSSDAIVRPSGLLPGSLAQPDTFLRSTLGLDRSSPIGLGVGVAVIDSGVEPSLDFVQSIAAFYEVDDAGPRRAMPYDDFGHGTHVAGLIGGSGIGSALQFQGVAPGVRMVVFKVLDASGQGRTSDVVAAIEFIVANRRLLGVDVINLSLGHPIFEPAATDPLVQAVERASRAGLIVVAAAGNFGINPATGEPGYAGITSPGNAPSAITVGAGSTGGTIGRRDDGVAPFSSRGPTWFDAFAKPDIIAPGERLVSVGVPGTPLYDQWPSLQVAGASGGTYLRLSGTSMATAVGSGVVALAVESNRRRNPTVRLAAQGARQNLSANAIKAVLQYTALPLVDEQGQEYDRLAQGGGGLNAAGAIQLAASINPAAPLGTTWMSIDSEPVTVIAGEALPWAQNIVWGVWLVPGSLLEVNDPCWGTNIVWGVSDGQNIVWGVSDNQVAGTNIVWGVNMVGAATADGGVLWGTPGGPDSTAWGTLDAENIVWGVSRNIVWGVADNIVWGV